MASVLKRLREVAEIERVSRKVKRALTRDQYRTMKEMHEDGVKQAKGTDRAGNEEVVELAEVFE